MPIKIDVIPVRFNMKNSHFFQLRYLFVVVVVVITSPLPRNAGTAPTATQVYVVNLIEVRLEERWQPI